MQLYIYLFIVYLFLLTGCTEKVPMKALVEKGNIYLVYKEGDRKEITGQHMDANAVLSPGCAYVAFLRAKSGQSNDTSDFCKPHNDLWLYDVKAGKEKAVVPGKTSDEPSQRIVGLHDLIFSPDGRWLYFTTCAWATSNAIHRYDIQTGKEQFFTSGNSLKVLQEGQYKGCIIASKHEYYPGGGSYDDYWLIDTTGKVLRDIGDSEDGKL